MATGNVHLESTKFFLEMVLSETCIKTLRIREKFGFIKEGDLDDLIDDLANYPVPVSTFQKLKVLQTFRIPRGVERFAFFARSIYSGTCYGKPYRAQYRTPPLKWFYLHESDSIDSNAGNAVIVNEGVFQFVDLPIRYLKKASKITTDIDKIKPETPQIVITKVRKTRYYTKRVR